MTCCCTSVVHRGESVAAVTDPNCWRIGQREVQADGIGISAADASRTAQLIFSMSADRDIPSARNPKESMSLF
jgi:hypothetical protein